MGLRFRKSIKLAPGLRMNLGLRGLSLSLGPRGSSVNIGSRGAYANLGIPGTGLSARTRLGGVSAGRSSENAKLAGLKVAFRLQDDGTVETVAEDGSPLPPRAIKMARAQNEEMLRYWLEEKCDHWNKGIDDLLGIHLNTPPPDRPPSDASKRGFPLSKPSEPVPMRITLSARIFRSRRERIDLLNAEARDQHAKDLASWERARDEHEKSESARLELFKTAGHLDAAKVQEYLAEVLGRIEWPRETAASLEVDDTATSVLIDVDLPEIEDMPDKSATVAARGLKLNIKDRSATQRRREYMMHVHGVAFRVVGEVFAALPRIEHVLASGFSQRADPSTGQVSDEYLFSVRVARRAWSALNFSRVADLDLPSCLGNFDLRRNMTSTGVFKPIEPFTSTEDGA